MMQNISILGGGWLGQPLAQTLLKNGHSIKVATRSNERLQHLNEQGLNAYQLDIDTQQGEITRFLQSELLIVNIPNKNVAAFEWLVQQVAQSPIKQVLFISSTSVYNTYPEPISEHSPAFNPAHPLACIERLWQQQNTLQTTVIRFAGLIGPNRHPGNFFKHGRPVPNPEAAVNLIHLDDCLGIIQAVIDQQVWDEVLNGCASTHPSKRDFYSAARASLGLSPPVFADDTQLPTKCIDNSKVKSRLEYRFNYDALLQETLFAACSNET